ncbi:hypothetical protein M9Y10_012226 [Tritrichomonas musculus]|uniref:Uncharacterized protein n=1 Tax=Tritrichomonas musculus TaxID=1915356 RepID=A0ABR2ICJ1_9EUKA
MINAKVVQCSTVTGENMNQLMADDIFVHFLEIEKNRTKEKNQKKLQYRKTMKFDCELSVLCAGNESSCILPFLSYFKNGNSEDTSDISESFDGDHYYKNNLFEYHMTKTSVQEGYKKIKQGQKDVQVILLVFSLIHKETFRKIVDIWCVIK